MVWDGGIIRSLLHGSKILLISDLVELLRLALHFRLHLLRICL